jgi:hypothetical protein
VKQLGVDALDPSLTFIADIIKPYLPLNYRFQYALNATREIINGFKYEVIFVMRNIDNDEDDYCLIDIIEKPWLIKDSQKYRRMTYNNCSLVNIFDENVAYEYERNPIYVNQQTDLSEDDLKSMEDQIIVIDSTTPAVQTTTSIVLDDITMPQSSKNLLDDFFNMNNYFQTTTTTTTQSPGLLTNSNMDALDKLFGIQKNESPVQKSSHDVSMTNSNADVVEQRTVYENANPNYQNQNDEALNELKIEIKKAFSELFQTDPIFQMNIIALINRRSDEVRVQQNYEYVANILANKLRDKIELYNERRNNEYQIIQTEDNQVTIDPNESLITRKKRSHHDSASHEIEKCIDEIVCSSSSSDDEVKKSFIISSKLKLRFIHYTD